MPSKCLPAAANPFFFFFLEGGGAAKSSPMCVCVRPRVGDAAKLAAPRHTFLEGSEICENRKENEKQGAGSRQKGVFGRRSKPQDSTQAAYP